MVWSLRRRAAERKGHKAGTSRVLDKRSDMPSTASIHNLNGEHNEYVAVGRPCERMTPVLGNAPEGRPRGSLRCRLVAQQNLSLRKSKSLAVSAVTLQEDERL